MLISIDNFANYREVYTKLASDRLAQTYSAIITSALSKEDYLGSLSDNEFLVITDEIKVEQVAKFLIFAFDTVAEKFYSKADIQRGFVISQGDIQAGRRSEFVHSTIGIVMSGTKQYLDAQELLNDLSSIHRLAKLPTKSNYLIERAKLSADDSIQQPQYNNKILIIEEDEAMTLLLSTILELQGYDITVSNKFEEDVNVIPAVIILDAGNNETRCGLSLCESLKSRKEYQNTKIIVTSVFHDKETVLKTGADLYIPKPYDMTLIVKWVDEFIRDYNISLL